MKSVVQLAFAGLALSANVNVGQLVNDGIQTVHDATQQHKNVGNLINDGINIIGDIAGDNSEELFHLGHVLHEVGHVASVAGTVAEVADVAFAKRGPTPGQVFNTVLNDADKVAKAIEPAVEVAGMIAGDAFSVNVGQLVNDGIQTVQDATQQHKNVGNLVNDGINIIGDIAGDNSEELFHLGHVLHEVGHVASVAGTVAEVADVAAFHLRHVLHEVGHVASVAGTVAEVADVAFAKRGPNVGQIVGTVLNDAAKVGEAIEPAVEIAGMIAGDAFSVNVGQLVNDGIQTVQDATQQHKNVGNLVNDGINIIGDIVGDNSEELFHLGHVLHEVGHVASVAGTVAEVADVVAFHLRHVLHEVGHVASVAGTVAEVADVAAFETGEGFLGF